MYERVSISLLEKNFVKAQKLRAKLSKMPLRYSSTLFNSFFISHQKNFSSNQLFSNFFSKIVTFTNFLPKMHFLCRRIFTNENLLELSDFRKAESIASSKRRSGTICLHLVRIFDDVIGFT